VVAVDLLTHAGDGLGAHRSYDVPFTSVQAEFEHLPFPEGSFDVAVFNGSVHYARDYGEVMGEVLRVLDAEGRLVLMDSPIYHQAESGQAMVRERQEHFLRTLGFASDALPQEGYLTFQRLERLGEELDLRWELVEPFYGWRWTLRPLKARLLGRREPAKFMLAVGSARTARPLHQPHGPVERLEQAVRQGLWPLRRATWL
jgi:SAM-dependent methyltransferase